jgi:hypothetical protein
MVDIFNLLMASRTKRITINAPSVEIASHWQTTIEYSPYQMNVFRRDFLIPNSVPDRVFIHRVVGRGVISLPFPILNGLIA